MLCLYSPRVVRRRRRLLTASGCEPKQAVRRSRVAGASPREAALLLPHRQLRAAPTPHHRGDAPVSRAHRDEWTSSQAATSHATSMAPARAGKAAKCPWPGPNCSFIDTSASAPHRPMSNPSADVGDAGCTSAASFAKVRVDAPAPSALRRGSSRPDGWAQLGRPGDHVVLLAGSRRSPSGISPIRGRSSGPSQAGQRRSSVAISRIR